MSYAYLASPYSSRKSDRAEAFREQQQRYEQACIVAAALMERGEVIFSPIAHSHPIEIIGKPKKPTHEFWMRQDRPLLQHASKLIVLMLPGWKESTGVQEEIGIARTIGMPIEFLPHD